jgi:hypothetical protein
MTNTLEGFQEIIRIRENVRRALDAQEVCCCCERVCECRRALRENDAPVWICNECLNQIESTPGVQKRTWGFYHA